MRVEFTGKHREYDGFFKLDSYALRFQRYDGSMTRPVERLVFERGDSAAVLLYDSEGRTVVLVEQFRLPAHLREEGNGTLLEVVAGTIEEGRAPEDVARCEVVEEAGFSLQQLEPVGCFYVSPSASGSTSPGSSRRTGSAAAGEWATARAFEYTKCHWPRRCSGFKRARYATPRRSSLCSIWH